MNGSLPQLGRRGEGWVALQLVLLAAIAAAGMPRLALALAPRSACGWPALP